MTFSRIFPAALLLAAFSVHAAPDTAASTKLPPLIAAAAVNSQNFPQTGRAVFLLDVDEQGKVTRVRLQHVDRTVAKQAAALALTKKIQPIQECSNGTAPDYRPSCRNVAGTAVQEAFFVVGAQQKRDLDISGISKVPLPPPPYPPVSIEENEQGMVRVRFVVGSDGKTYGARVTRSSGYHRLDRASVRAIERQPQFEPARLQGKPVWIEMERGFNYAF
ncbi:energy transducer TonB [Kingella pumchi]|uniref:Energy transducer TonB n=1 Tax=Kingella pumchi TaxID=2779506 RepID=A0ABS9NLH8_9NEIS|nr:energy transducer TonB [Kingella pumchi]MCG6503654.1 energy transducer TonB [Kingella pumchi]